MHDAGALAAFRESAGWAALSAGDPADVSGDEACQPGIA